ncbi:MAG: Gfo/Idh/MocA family oxidoreductase [Victivallales bacterium]|nr:Gfo/Idh/MocA family oxidoreductase [Victivallales bacterium]MBR4221719.1 Gfo/Idh/MocA family oxidoreductase [Victivallales bacterium]
MERIKIAQLGMTHEHAAGKMASIKKLPDIYEIVGVVDDRETATTPNCYNPTTIYDDVPRLTLEQLLAYPGLQAVCVETPNNELVDATMPMMEKGLAIHMDKPAGESLPAFKKLLDGCRAKNLPFQMGYMFRGNPALNLIIERVRQGWIGDVFSIRADMNHNYGGARYQEYIGKFKGGLAYNLICHLIDYVTTLMGAPENVIPILKNTANEPSNYKNNCLTILEYSNAIAELASCSYESATTFGRRLKVSGTKGYFELCPIERFDGQPLKMTMNLVEPKGEYEAGKHELDFGVQKDRYTAQFEELAKIIRGEMPNNTDYDKDYLVHRIVLAAGSYIRW